MKELGANICVVGDDDQTIYQFRGSDSNNILTFIQRYNIQKYIVLDTDYRSTSGIVDVAHKVIMQNSKRLPKTMVSGCSTVYDDGDIEATELFRRWQSVNSPFNKKELADSLQVLMTIDIANMKYYPEFLKGLPITDDGRAETEIILYNLGKFSQVMADYEAINFTLKPRSKILGFCNFLKYTDAVSIMTVHQSKGLEYAAVFIPKLNKNFFPAQKVGGKSVHVF